MNRTDEGLRGDVDPAAAEVAGLITPVPGGVGPMTIATLLRNTVRAARVPPWRSCVPRGGVTVWFLPLQCGVGGSCPGRRLLL